MGMIGFALGVFSVVAVSMVAVVYLSVGLHPVAQQLVVSLTKNAEDWFFSAYHDRYAPYPTYWAINPSLGKGSLFLYDLYNPDGSFVYTNTGSLLEGRDATAVLRAIEKSKALNLKARSLRQVSSSVNLEDLH